MIHFFLSHISRRVYYACSLFVTLAFIVSGSPVTAITNTTVSASASTVSANNLVVAADGIATSLVTVTIKNFFGASLNGVPVTLTTPNSSATITSGAAATDASGVMTFTVKSTVAASYVFTAASGGTTITQTATIQFTTAPASATLSRVTSDSSFVAADGSSVATLTVTAVNAGGFPSGGLVVTPATTLAGSTITPGSTMTNAQGVATFTLKSSSSGLATFSVTIGGVAIHQTPQVTFYSTVTDAAQTTVSVSASSIVADGTTKASATVTVKNATGQVLSGRTVTLTSSLPEVLITPGSAVSDANGSATFQVSHTVAGTTVLTATVGGVTITQKPTLTFTAVPAQPVVPVFSASLSTIVSSQSSIVADGVSAATVTATVKDTAGQPMSGKIVTPLTTRGVLTPAQATTNASGIATFTLTGTTTGTATLTGTLNDGIIAITPMVTFTAPPVQPALPVFSPSLSTIVATPSTVVADGISAATVTVTMKDVNGQPIAGDHVRLDAGVANVNASMLTTNASGVAVFQLTSVVPGTATLSVFGDQGSVTMHPTVIFTAPVVIPPVNPPSVDTVISASRSVVQAAPTIVIANGVQVSTVSVYVYTADGTPLAGRSVVLSGGGGVVKITPSAVATDVNGRAVFFLSSNVVGGYGFVALADGVSLAQVPTVQFVSPPVDTTVSMGQSYIGASPASVIADASHGSVVTVIARNSAGIALAGTTVSIISSFPAVVITPAQSTTDANGVATFVVKSGTSGLAQLTALINGLPIDTKSAVTFTPNQPVASCASGLIPPGTLVKLDDDGDAYTQADSAVYYFGQDCKRHSFPNDRVYFTWYNDFSRVVTISPILMANLPLGKNVTYRPGIRMIKFLTVPNVYAVSQKGLLRWVKTEGAAMALFGPAWNKYIDDVADTFYLDYRFGADIQWSGDYSIGAELTNTPTIDASL